MRRPIGVVALVVLSGALLLLAIAVAPSEANVPGRNGLIVFQRLVGTPSKRATPARRCSRSTRTEAASTRSRAARRSPRILPGRPMPGASSWSTGRDSDCSTSVQGGSGR